MAPPTSVLVMTVLTAVPFGLAVRDTLRTPPTHVAPSGDEIADFQRQADAAEAARRTRGGSLGGAELAKRLIGSTRGSVGGELASIKLGERIGHTPEAIALLADPTSGLQISWPTNDTTTQRVIVTAARDGGECGLVAPLTLAWGEPHELDATTRVWIGPAGDRAVVDTEPCRLTFDRYVQSADLVASEISFNWIGMPVNKLPDRPGAGVTGASIAWEDRGLLDGAGPTSIRVDTAGGTIVGLEASGRASPDSLTELRAAVYLSRGEPTTTSAERTSWHGSPPVALELHGTQFHLYAGGAAEGHP